MSGGHVMYVRGAGEEEATGAGQAPAPAPASQRPQEKNGSARYGGGNRGQGSGGGGVPLQCCTRPGGRGAHGTCVARRLAPGHCCCHRCAVRAGVCGCVGMQCLKGGLWSLGGTSRRGAPHGWVGPAALRSRCPGAGRPGRSQMGRHGRPAAGQAKGGQGGARGEYRRVQGWAAVSDGSSRRAGTLAAGRALPCSTPTTHKAE